MRNRRKERVEKRSRGLDEQEPLSTFPLAFLSPLSTYPLAFLFPLATFPLVLALASFPLSIIRTNPELGTGYPNPSYGELVSAEGKRG